ncbi:hypothetical protein pb186bvf_012399 [Paramecium bursaria]
MNQGVIVVEKLKIKEAETQYEKIKARSQIDDQKLKGINFQQSIELKKNNHRVLFPVVHKDCQYFQTPEHICGCLAQILQNGEQLTKCAQLLLTNLNNLQIPTIPYFAVQSVHSRTDFVSIIQGFVLNKILRSSQYVSSLALEKPQLLFREMMKRRDDSNNFTNRIKLDELYNKLEGFEFYAACLLDWVKLNVPMRFKSCKHIECFDFTSIVFRLENEILIQKNVPEQERKYSKIICGFNVDGCYCESQCVASYENMIAELVIDYELMDAIRKSEQEAYKFIYIKQTKEILDELTYANKQQNELPIQGNSKIKIKRIDSINIQPTTLKIGDFSILQVMNLKNAKAVQKKTQFQKYQDIEISLICPISKKQIQYPARCLKCIKQDCADLKSMIEFLNDGKQKKSASYFECPLCNKKWDKRYSDIIPQTVFYFDEFIMGIIMQSKRQENQKKLIHKGSQVLLNEYKQQHRILRKQIEEHYPNGKVFYSNLLCCVSGKLLKDPLIIKDCAEKTRVSFESFFNIYKEQGYLEVATKTIIICKCMNCNQTGIKSIDQLAYDEMFVEVIEIYNKLDAQQKSRININDAILYDYNTKQLLNAQQNLNKVNYPTNPLQRGFVNDMQPEEFEEYSKQFDRYEIDGKMIQINQIQISHFGIKQIQTAQGMFVQNREEILNQYNQIGQSEEFKKWGLQVTDIKMKPRKKNDEDDQFNQ